MYNNSSMLNTINVEIDQNWLCVKSDIADSNNNNALYISQPGQEQMWRAPVVSQPIVYRKIKSVKIIVENKIVECTFEDGTKEKSVCYDPDVFDMERAISICVAKKAMGGSSAYNKAVRQGMKVYDTQLKKEAEEEAAKKRAEKKRAKFLAYKEHRKAKRIAEEEAKKAAEREEQITIQTEAYVRAMRMIKEENA